VTHDLLTALLVGVAAFLLLRVVFGRGKRITGADARAKVAEGALLLDVRTEAEFHAAALAGAKNIPVQSLDSRVSELDLGRPIVVYCRSGARSSRAASLLRKRGFDVHDLGSIHAW
jgi:rhodanese-related sulfurtransferase